MYAIRSYYVLSQDVYRKHLAGLKKRQAVMIGYSDSNKDSGIVASRWALHEAQRQLVRIGAEELVEIVFFHGRGTGTRDRGPSRPARRYVPLGRCGPPRR